MPSLLPYRAELGPGEHRAPAVRAREALSVRPSWVTDSLVALTIAELPFAVQLQRHIPYFSDWSPLPYLANVLDVLLVAVTLFLVLRASRSFPVLHGVTEWLLIGLTVFSANQLRRHAFPVRLSEVWARFVPGAAHLFVVVRLVLIAAVLFLLLRWARRDRSALVRVTYLVLLIVSPFALWGVGRALTEIVRGGLAPGFAGREFVGESAAVTDKNAPRVVIALF
ncbi:MAG TPA: hypothetical protein VJN70_17635, partial [Gemmatimonadaceae bacterium]|nr:hypothetical protein [Gemmatimonadaceae bacterium]